MNQGVRIWVRSGVMLLCLATLGGCSGYIGSARSIRPDELHTSDWTAVGDVHLIRQQAEHDCGAAALAMVLAHYQPDLSTAAVELAESGERLSAVDLRDYARAHGFSAFVMEGSPKDLLFELRHGRPVIVGMAKPTIEGRVAHYEVVVGINSSDRMIATLDPAEGYRQNSYEGFVAEWQHAGRVLIVVIPVPIVIEPTQLSLQDD